MSCDIFLVFMTVSLPPESCAFTLMYFLSGGEEASAIPSRDLLLESENGVNGGGGKKCFDFMAAKQKGHSSGQADEQPRGLDGAWRGHRPHRASSVTVLGTTSLSPLSSDSNEVPLFYESLTSMNFWEL